jgi:hypothetical protein
MRMARACQQGVNKQCFADGDAAGSSGVTGAAPRAADPVVRIERTGARPTDAMSASATPALRRWSPLASSPGCAFYATCSSSLPTPSTPACNVSRRRTDLTRRTSAVLSRGAVREVRTSRRPCWLPSSSGGIIMGHAALR